MTDRALLLRVTLHAPAYHGQPEWPPAPARVFQALVAGTSTRLDEPEVGAALRWLELQSAPIIACPDGVVGQAVTTFVPNNDLDTKGGDPERLASIRVPKRVQTRHLAHGRLLYAWSIKDTDRADVIVDLAHGLYQLGRGVDMAWATGVVVSREALDQELHGWDGEVHYPAPEAPGASLACPRAGTLDSLHVRYAESLARFHTVGQGRKATQVFAQPARALLREVAYDARARRAVFELRDLDRPARFASSPATDAVATVTGWRDAAVERLVTAGMDAGLVSGVLVGRRPGEPEVVPTSLRARVVGLPSIGHKDSDESVRRLLVELPAGAPLAFEDARWAFSGLVRGSATLVEAEDARMLRHYLRSSRSWSSVTPLALSARRRRVDPGNRAQEAKGAVERQEEEEVAIHAVRQALRHAGVRAPARKIRVQREPFGPHGERAERFQVLPRFSKERLWHVRIEFARDVRGPLLLGDGRFLGLGLLRPDRQAVPSIVACRIVGGRAGPIDPSALARHLRRAVLARAQAVWGRRALPEHVSGHRQDGRPATGHRHLCYLVDVPRDRVLVWQPRAERRLVEALEGLVELRAGPMGVLRLAPLALEADDPLLAPATTWKSVTPYRLQRHRKVGSAAEATTLDVLAACEHLPPVEVEVAGVRSVSGGVEADVRLRFEHPVAGPLVLGRTRHLGGGLFEGRP